MIKRIVMCLMLCASAGASAQVNHLGRPHHAPPGVQQGASSQFFVPGGTVFRNPDGSTVTVPTQTFTPYPGDSTQIRQLTVPDPAPEQFTPDGGAIRAVQLRMGAEYYGYIEELDRRTGSRGRIPVGSLHVEELNMGSSEDVTGRSGPARASPPSPEVEGPMFAADAPPPAIDGVPTDPVM